MNLNLANSLIAYLRTFPRNGQTPEDPERYKDSKQQKRDTKTYYNQLPDYLAKLAEYEPILATLDNSINNLQRGLSNVAKVQTEYNASLVTAIKDLTLFDEIESKIAKTLKITTKQSITLSNVYDGYSKTLRLSRKEIDKYRTGLDSILPMQSENLSKLSQESDDKKQLIGYTDALMMSQQHLQQYQQLTAEQSRDYLLYTEGAGKNIGSQLLATQELAEAWTTATGQTGVYNTILQEVSSLSTEIRSEYSRMGGNLEIAVLKSKQLGLSMADLDKIGTNLLNIEESVGKEIEYQLISGRRLVDTNGRSLTMRFREAKMMGDGIKMAETMNDLVATQGDIIEKGSFLQKKGLADALGMSVEQLIVAKQRLEINKKVAAASGMDFEKFSSLTKKEQQEQIDLFKKAEMVKAKSNDPEDIKQGVVDSAKASISAIESLQKKEIDLQTPAEKSAIALESIRDHGIKIQRGQISVDEMKKSFKPSTFTATVEQTQLMQSTTERVNAAMLRSIGSYQNLITVVDATKTSLDSFSKLDPIMESIVTGTESILKSILDKIKEKLGIEKQEPVPKPTPGLGAGMIQETVNTVGTGKDALIMKDGLIKFHPSDKFMQVNDSAMIAGTSIDGNKKLAKSISGGGVDMNKMVAAIQTAISNLTKPSAAGVDMNKMVAAIQTAFAGVQITVNVDPMKIDREIKFRTATINSKQGRN